jgi:adenine/guanine/hypoxanthine permease
VACFIVGLFGNLPFGCAPGLGLSSYLSYSLVQAGLATLEEALTACFASGIVLLVVVLTGITTLLMKVVPECVKYGIVVGMGLLIAMIGMVSVKLIVPNEDTIVGLGDVLGDLTLQLTMFGLILVASFIYWDVKGGILLGIALVAVLQWAITSSWPAHVAEVPIFHHNNYIVPSCLIDPDKAVILWTAVGAFLLICVFDISGVVFGLATLGGLIREGDGQIPGSLWVFLASSAGTVTAAFFGSTPIICCVETASGIKEGGRTGLVAIVIGLYFVLSLFLSPLFGAVPNDATAPVLMLVGVMMMGESAKVNWQSMDQALPAFLTAILMPLTYSITNGMILGLAASFAFYFTTGGAFVDLKNLVSICYRGRDAVPIPEYEELENSSGEYGNGEIHRLLLDTGSESESARRSIEQARRMLKGSERNVEYGAILY